jgi:hypothetical protein
MSETSIDQVVCKPNNNGKTSITFDRFLSDDNFSDDECQSAESLEDMVGELRENDDSPFEDEKRIHLKKEEPSAFLFQRMAQKKMRMSTKKGNNNLSSFRNSIAEDQRIHVAESDEIPTFPSGFRLWSSVEAHKICSACLLLTLPSIFSVCIALLVVFLVRNNSQGGVSMPSMSPTLSSISPSPAPSHTTLPAPAAHGVPNSDDDETTILTNTPTVQQQQQEGVVMDKTLNIVSIQQANSSGIGETSDMVTKPQLIGLIDSPMDLDELVLLIETDSDLAITKHPAPLDLSKLRETTTKGGDKLHCNIKVDGVRVAVECRANEETCRVYLEPLVSTLCDQTDDDASSS